MFPGCVPDRGDQPLDVAVVDARGGVAEVDGDAASEASGQEKDTLTMSTLRGLTVTGLFGPPKWGVRTGGWGWSICWAVASGCVDHATRSVIDSEPP